MPLPTLVNWAVPIRSDWGLGKALPRRRPAAASPCHSLRARRSLANSRSRRVNSRLTACYRVRAEANAIEERARGLAVEQSVEMPVGAIREAAIIEEIV